MLHRRKQQWIPAVCVERGCELNPLCNMWILGALVMSGSAGKFCEWHKVLHAKCVEVEGDRQLMSFVLRCQVRMCR